ncbi:MAG: hypothetical protein JRJ56_08605 [Deltaproteobacteria bacterium]|nr:hypothetical protein [Deltaproteobacteria bacterium]
MKGRFSSESGVSLIAAVFMILILSFLGWVMVGMSNLSSREAGNEIQAARAYYAACGAAEARIVRLDRGDPAARLYYRFAAVQAEVEARQEAASYWRLQVTATDGDPATTEYARRRLVVKFLQQ